MPKPSVILECKYIGKDSLWLAIYGDHWRKWKEYRTQRAAILAKQNLEQKHKDLEFRIVDNNEPSPHNRPS